MKSYLYKILFAATIIISFISVLKGQNRIRFNERDLFASGINVAWTRFDQELSNPNLILFRQICEEIHDNGGNALRLWLHTTGGNTPQYNSDGYAVGPGTNSIWNFEQILDIAWENEIGLMLCLWSHDMMDVSRSEYLLNRNELFLTDTSYTMAYVNNALIPMVDSVKGHPAILAWEIFNEPEGFSDEFGWGTRRKVPESAIQRVVNLCAGAIHRTDSTALVTNGTWKLLAMTDAQNLAKSSPESILAGLSENEKRGLEEFYHERYGVNMSIEEIIYKNSNVNASSYNYYRDDRLIAAGGDPDGTLDFYTVHFYDDFGTALSPFHHSKDYWELDKPLCIGEFFMETANGVDWQDKYRILYNAGYAGALTWQWWGDTQANDQAKNRNHDHTLTALNDMWENYHEDIVVVPKTGTIYSCKIDRTTVESGDSVTITWDTESGSEVNINGESVPYKGSKSYTQYFTTDYIFAAEGIVSGNRSFTVEYIPSGQIFYFYVKPQQAVLGDTVRLIWRTSKGSEVYLNSESVNYIDTVYAVPDESHKTFILDAGGEDTNSRELTVNFISAGEANRALAGNISVSSIAPDLPNNDGEKIIDGNLNTEWTSAISDGGQTVLLDLTKQYGVKTVKVFWGEHYPKQYLLYGSTDQSNWSTLKFAQIANGGIDSISVNGLIVRYLFLSMQPQDYSTPISIKELEVYIEPDISGAGEETVPTSYGLSQNYPNPFNPSTVIKYSLPSRSFVKLNVYDILGRQVTQLVNDVNEAGNYEIVFSTSGLDKSLSSGVYIYRLQAGEYVQTRKMLILK